MEKLKQNKEGITVVSLVVTIIVLLILSGVAISLTVGNNGLFKRTQNAANTWKDAERDEADEMNNFIDTFDKLTNNGKDANEDIDKVTGNENINTKTRDKNGNKIVISAGFKVINPEEDVTKGIVIEDVTAGDVTRKGNEYVGIPITHVNGEKINTVVDNTKVEHTIELARYTFDIGVYNESNNSYNGTGAIKTKITDGSIIDSVYTEEIYQSSEDINTIAKDINKFKESVKNSGGYYLARYESGDSSTTSDRTSTSSQTAIPVFKNNQIRYNYITQPNAAILMRNLYSNQSRNYESDLVNSYAWDTAIVFIQEFSGDTDYSKQIRLQSTIAKTGEASDGTNKDVRCNIYDMAGNVREWTTETISNTSYPYVNRGGYFNSNNHYTAHRYNNGSSKYNDIGYRRNIICLILNNHNNIIKLLYCLKIRKVINSV